MDLRQKELMQERLKSLRKKSGQTQKQVGDSINTSSGAIGNYETGKRLPSIEIICDLSRKYNVEVGYLLGIEEYSANRTSKKEISAEAGLIKNRFLDISVLSVENQKCIVKYFHFLRNCELEEI